MSRNKPRLILASAGAGFRHMKVAWHLCCLCQRKLKVKDHTICPANNPNPQTRNKGYETLARIMSQLRDEGFGQHEVCPNICINDLDEGDGFLATFIKRRARYHGACVAKYTVKHSFDKLLADLRKDAADSRVAALLSPPAVPPTPPPGTSAGSESTPRVTRSAALQSQVKDVCFLCKKPAAWNKALYNCATEQMSDSVARCAQILKDSELLALIVTGGDLMAQEAKYHSICLSRLYNRARRQTNQDNEGDSSDTTACEGLAFADLLLYIREKLAELGPKCVFRMSHLRQMYADRLSQVFGVDKELVQLEHTTRFREKVLAHFPELTAELSGREYLLKLSGANIFNNLDNEDQDDDALALNRFVRGMRRSILAAEAQFQGQFQSGCEEACIPPSLLAMINMTLYGSAVVADCRATKPALTICQLIIANFSRTCPKGDIVRFKKHREPPFVLYSALSTYGRGGDASSIDRMHQHGINSSSNRVTEVTSQCCRLVVARAEEEGVVCPQSLRTGLFTTGALDNIDYKPSSTTSEGEFHGTGISIMQFPIKGQDKSAGRRHFWTDFNDVEKGGERSVPDLPDSYSVVPECVLPIKQPDMPCHSMEIADRMIFEGDFTIDCEKDWLSHVHRYLAEENGADENFSDISWAAYRASQVTETHEPAVIAMLPLLHQKSACVSTMRHGMETIAKITAYLNGHQTPVICVDQPLFALANVIKWNWPEKFSKYVAMLGPFHIEQSFLKVIGQLMLYSGWCGLIANSGITTLGSAEALLKVTHVTKSRAIHQVTAAVLHSLLVDAYHSENPDNETENLISLEDWVTLHLAQKEPTFTFWYLVLKLEILLLSFVRGLREGNFKLYQECKKEMLPWYFVTNHHNYARWLSVDVYDLEALEETAPDVHQQFLSGNFVVRKTRRAFSALALDQAHEQENAGVKAKGRAIGISRDGASTRRFTIGGPEVCRLLREFEGAEEEQDDEPGPHHEQYPALQEKFASKCSSLKETFLSCANPFLNHGNELVVLDTFAGVEQEGANALLSLESKGKALYELFVQERIREKSKSIFAKINKVDSSIFISKKRPSQVSTIRGLKYDVQLFSRLFIVSLSRNLDLDAFFAHENQSVPPALSSNGEMKSGDKSHLTSILEKLAGIPGEPQVCQAIVLDGAVLAHNLKPAPGLRNFDEYFDRQLKPYVLSLVRKHHAKRVDAVWGLYNTASTKGATRDARGMGVRRQGLPTKGRLPTNWEDYLRNAANKTEMFRFLAGKFLSSIDNLQILTNLENVIRTAGPGTTFLDGISCGQRDEADGRIVLHIHDAVTAGSTSVLVRSTDTDVVVLCVSFFIKFSYIGLKELWILYGSGANQRYIPAHSIALTLGQEKSEGLRGFHAFTGCDSVSFFCSKGKKTAWKVWDESFNSTFQAISQPTGEAPSDTVIQQLEKYTVGLYNCSKISDVTGVNEARRYLFGTLNKPLCLIPPTSAALKQHALRAAYQGGELWGSADHLHPNLPPPQGWGWIVESGDLRPHWSDQPDVWSACRELDRCGCSLQCNTNRCRCYKNQLPCTLNCKKCTGKCNNPMKENTPIAQPEGSRLQVEAEDEDVDGDLETYGEST